MLEMKTENKKEKKERRKKKGEPASRARLKPALHRERARAQGWPSKGPTQQPVSQAQQGVECLKEANLIV